MTILPGQELQDRFVGEEKDHIMKALNRHLPDDRPPFSGILADREIELLCKGDRPMISPFSQEAIREVDGKKIISYGLSSYGYDLRLGNKFKIFTNINTAMIDPKNFDPASFVEHEGDTCIIPPNSFVLGVSKEYIRMPKNVTGVVLSKSTYARGGNICLATPLEAEWEGYVTLEFSNTSPLPSIMYAGEGCCQVLFFAGNPCTTTYADRGGKYMNQGPTPVSPCL